MGLEVKSKMQEKNARANQFHNTDYRRVNLSFREYKEKFSNNPYNLLENFDVNFPAMKDSNAPNNIRDPTIDTNNILINKNFNAVLKNKTSIPKSLHRMSPKTPSTYNYNVDNTFNTLILPNIQVKLSKFSEKYQNGSGKATDIIKDILARKSKRIQNRNLKWRSVQELFLNRTNEIYYCNESARQTTLFDKIKPSAHMETLWKSTSSGLVYIEKKETLSHSDYSGFWNID
uniref:Uncharacterized protein n=1 Tax=Glossina palpalis gambiensis TaxID=67801 RepID=A0A1B0BYE9_9MUSC